MDERRTIRMQDHLDRILKAAQKEDNIHVGDMVRQMQGVDVGEMFDYFNINNVIRVMPKWVEEEEEEGEQKKILSPRMMCWQAVFILTNGMTRKDARSLTRNGDRVSAMKRIYVAHVYAFALLLKAAILENREALDFIAEEIEEQGLSFFIQDIPTEILMAWLWIPERSTTFHPQIHVLLDKVYRSYEIMQAQKNNEDIACFFSKQQFEKVD